MHAHFEADHTWSGRLCRLSARGPDYSDAMSDALTEAGNEARPVSRRPSASTSCCSLLAYGEVAAFTGSPTRPGWLLTCVDVSIWRMAAAEMNHYEMLRDALEARGVDVVPAITGYASALENYHRLTTPSTWLEALVKTYVGDALAADFYRDRRCALTRSAMVRSVLAETVHSQFVVAEVRKAVTARRTSARSRFGLWVALVAGEAIAGAVLFGRPRRTGICGSGEGGLAHLTEFRSVAAHADDRMEQLSGAG